MLKHSLKTKRQLCGLLPILVVHLLMISSFTGCVVIGAAVKSIAGLSKASLPMELGITIDVPGLELIEEIDTRGGLFGDGESFQLYQFDGTVSESLEQEVSTLPGWCAVKGDVEFPPSVTGMQYQNSPPLKVEHGYLFYQDRSPADDSGPPEITWMRNYTYALIDMDNLRLYIFTFDS